MKLFFCFLYKFTINAGGVNVVNARHTITIDDRTFQKLRSKGNFGETYSKLISRIIKDSDGYHKLAEG